MAMETNSENNLMELEYHRIPRQVEPLAGEFGSLDQ